MTENDDIKDRPATPGETEDDEDKDFLPPLHISSLILPFYTQALLKMGLLEDPEGGPGEENLELAKRMIDLLDLFKQKTDGRLDADEEKFLESMLQQLKMHYMQKAKVIKL
jgi:hypothetical protein